MEEGNQQFNSKTKKSLISSLILFILIFQILLLVPRPAQAIFGAGDVTFSTIVADIPGKILDTMKKLVKQVVASAYKNALRTFTQKIAYNTAVKIASGGAGQGPLFTTKEFTSLLRDAGDAAIGDALDTMSTEAWGFSLCDADPKIRIDIQANLALDLGISEPRQAKCTGSEIFNNLANAQPIEVTGGLGIGIAGQDPAQVSAALMKSFPEVFSPEGNNLGQYLKMYSLTKEKEEKAKEKAKEEATSEGGFLPLKSIITGDTKTPAKTIGGTQLFSLEQAINPDNTFTGELAADFIGVFTNTLIKKYMETILTKGLNPGADTSGGNLTNLLAGGGSGIAAAEAKFASFTQPNLGGGGSIDILNKLSICPAQYAEVENCVMDSNFRTAVEQHLRVEEAIEMGYLDGGKPFGYGQGGSLLDYQSGYAYRNLVIMRRHRIVPVTWELAAQYIRDYGAGNYSLNDLVALYDDETSPFYHLIDPDWVLKAPDNYCRRQGYGEGTVFDEYFDHDGENVTPKVREVQRQETCVDDQSCIAENVDGTCQAYGYCIKEDPIWKFSGDQCPDYYASCKTYQSRDGQQTSYLEDTLDFNGCTADNVGCQWYCKLYDDANERWRCYWDGDDYGYYGSSNPWGPAAVNNNQYYDWLAHLDASAQTCDASAEGCQEFLRTTSGTNLIKNDNFDYFTGTVDDGVPDTVNSWDPQGAAAPEIVTIDTTTPYRGYNAVKLPHGAPASDSIRYTHVSTRSVIGRTFTFSVFAKSDDSAACGGNASIKLSTNLGSSLVTLPIDNLNNSWQRYELSQTFDVNFDNVEVYLGVDSGCNVFFDSAMLEEKVIGESTNAGEFIDYGTVNKLYLAGERLSCSDEDVGCQWYTPLAGGDPVPAKISSDDLCLESEVGCKAYEETPLTNIIPDSNNVNRTGKYCSVVPPSGIPTPCYSDEPPDDCPGANNYCYPSISLIASTGTQCSAAYVGCEEFTNLDEVAKGGEGKEYYTFLKQCVPLDDPSIATYYAWEGDEVAGYQLRAFKLKVSNLNPFPGERGRAPCTHLEIGEDLPLDCKDTSTNVQECSSVYGTDPDCIEFFDASLRTFYRYKSQTITVSDNCHPERNSLDDQVYYGLPSESTSCPASTAGCREYLGNAGYNYQEIFNDNFEGGTIQEWWGGTLSNASIIAGGHSVFATSELHRNIDGLTEDKKTYLLTFWAKGNGTPLIHFMNAIPGPGRTGMFADDEPSTPAPEITLDPDEWHSYTLGPVTIDINDSDNWLNFLPAELYIHNLSGESFFDNIVLTETTDNIYLIRGSATICTGSENCAAYQGANNQTYYLKSFTKLCAEEVAGCEELIDTRNTSNPYSETFGTETQSIIYTFDDVTVNYVNNPEVYCDAADRGCRALGRPVITPNDPDVLTDYETVYLKDDAEQYSTIWCDQSEVGCEQYSFSGGSGTAYFKDPGAKVCEYKQPTGSLVYDWYKSGTEEECPTTNPPDDPAPFIPNQGWVGLCTNQYDGCTAYRDPRDPVGCNPDYPYEVDEYSNPIRRVSSPGCETYYYINYSVDQNSCNGTVDEQKGCKLFYDTDDPANVFTADLSPDGQKTYCDDSDPSYYGAVCTTDSDCGSGTCVENVESGIPYNCDQTVVDPTDPLFCDSNSVIKVERDRVCDEWLYCKTSLQVDDPNDSDGDGQTTEEACVEIGTCNQLGASGLCSHPIEESPVNVTGGIAGYDLDQFQNMSGFVSAGLMYGCSNDYAISCTVATEDSDCGSGNHCEIIEGYFPYSEMYEVGLGGASVDDLVPFGDFESDSTKNFMVCEGAGDQKEACLDDSQCPSGASGACHGSDKWGVISSGRIDITEGPGNSAALDENNYLLYTAEDSSSNGQGVRVNLGPNIANLQEYTASFEFKFEDPPAAGQSAITVSFAQFDDVVPTSIIWQESLGQFEGTTGWQQYIIGPYATQNVLDESKDVYLLFKNNSANLSFSLENVSLKPVLAVQSAETGGLRGDYYDLTGDIETGVLLHQRFGAYNSTLYSDYLDYSPFNSVLENQTGNPNGDMSAVRWTGQVLADTTGSYTFWFDVDDGIKFYIDDLDTDVWAGANWNDGAKEVSYTASSLSAGWHNIKIEYYQNETGAKMRFGWDPPTGGRVYPVPADHLTHEGTPSYLARSCRAYPREDSLACHYVDDDLLEFNGWQGYCIETDPTNPNRCLTWWPVDIISGESSVFGTIEQAGYQDRTSLYMCLEAEGNYNNIDTFIASYGSIAFLEAETGGFSGGVNHTSPLIGETLQYRRPIQTKIDGGVHSAEPFSCGNIEAFIPCGELNAAGICGCNAEDIYRGSRPVDPRDQYYEWEIERIDWTLQRSSHADWEVTPLTFTMNAPNWEVDWHKDSCDSENCLYIKAYFDSDDKLESFDVHMADGSGDDGGAWYAGIVYLREPCTEIAKVVDVAENKAWANRTSATSSYEVPDLYYNYSSDEAPFGASYAGNVDPHLGVEGGAWDGKTEDGQQPVYVENKDTTPTTNATNQNRAGRPYSCEGDCTGKVCLGGPHDVANSSTQYPCANDSDCEGTDPDDRGFCVGVGTCTKASPSDPDVACTSNADCSGEVCAGIQASGWGDGLSGPNTWAIDRLKRLFAKPYGAWSWNSSLGRYDRNDTLMSSWVTAFNNMVLCNGTGVGPRPGWSADYCAILPHVENIEVNGVSGNVTLSSGGTINLTFNNFVDPEQEALKKITVDWGDDSELTSVIWNGAPKTDPANPHLLSHSYSYNGSPYTAQIEIMIEDNWGFCNVNGRDCNIDAFNYDFFGGAVEVTAP